MMANLRSRLEGRLLRLTLDRAEKRNALNHDLCQELVDAAAGAALNEDVGAILIDAEGPVFCAGMDLDESLAEDAVERTAIHHELFTWGERAEKPIIAAVQGGAFAGGVGLVAQAHIVITATDALFGLPEVRIGMWPFVIWRSLVHAIGERRAMELSLTGRRFSAEEALRMGLVHQTHAPETLAAQAQAIAVALAEHGGDAVHRGIVLMRESRHRDRESAIDLALALRADQLTSREFRERVEHVRAKRKP